MISKLDTKQLRRCFGHFATGITVVTCRTEDAAHGVTVNAFTSVSLDPPLVLVSIDRRAAACRLLEGNSFTVNLLEADQNDLAWHFAGQPKHELNITWEEGELAPRLGGCVAWIECGPWRSYDGGDHVLYVGEVKNFESSGGEPLLFYGGKFRHIGEAIEGVPWIDSLDSPSSMGWFGNPLRLPSVDRRGG
jgi:flavin reductase (DIM6/NTAB) family NADH-FMN oxidoreductase RutF